MTKETAAPIRMLVVGDDEDVMQWISESVRQAQVPWRLRTTSPLRVISPENALAIQNILVLVWERPIAVSATGINNQHAPITRSVEGILCELEAMGGEELLRRVVVIGRTITREDATFCAEIGVKLVVPLPSKRSHWNQESPGFVRRIAKLHEEEVALKESAGEKAIDAFCQLLPNWQKVSDESKMEASENLLASLGDSSRYCEFMARRAIKESDPEAAERWLRRAVHKNPNYLRAVQLLADLYVSQKRFREALSLLERLRANNPRNLRRLTKIGKCYFMMGDLAKAEKAFKDAVEIDQFFKPGREELGKIKCLLGDWDSGRKLLEQASNARHLATFFNSVGVRLVEQRRYRDSIEHYTKAQTVVPGNEETHRLFFNIGLAYAKWGRLREAKTYLKLALVRQPNYEKALTLLQQIDVRLDAVA